MTSIERMGIAKGIEQGIEKGKQEGLKEGIKLAVLNLRAELGLTTEKIAEVMKIPLETVQQYLDASEKQATK